MNVPVVEDEPRLAGLLRLGPAEEGYAVTVAHHGDDRVRGPDAGAGDYLTEPFSFADPAARTVPVGRQEVELTAQESALVEVFARRIDPVLRRDQIMDHVRDFASTPGSNVVDQHVDDVHRKLTDAGCNVALITVRGVGYRMSPTA